MRRAAHPAFQSLVSPKLGDVRGFSSVGIAAGLKRSGKTDLGIICSDRPCSAAGLFTQNKVAAAPVVYDRDLLRKRSRTVRAIVVNSGHANAATGPAGMALARRMALATEQSLGVPAGSVLICSTGIIGDLPNETILRRGIEMASRRLSTTDAEFQKAILTTDKVEKVAGVQMRFPGGRVATLVGAAKGSGMIAPNMATMLGFLVTDISISPAMLKQMLSLAGNVSFNCISVDADTSTNDTLLLLANGASGVTIGAGRISRSAAPSADASGAGRNRPAARLFLEALTWVCERLAWKMVEDGEGATKVIEVVVRGVRTAASGKLAARCVADSLLVRTAVHGEDPNVGRVLAALGRSGVREVQDDKIDVAFNGVRAISRGVVDRATYGTTALRSALRTKCVRIDIDLHGGRQSGRFLSCDLSAEYVRINSEYRT